MASNGLVIGTCIFIEYLRAKDKSKTTLYLIPDNLNLFISAVTVYELYMVQRIVKRKTIYKF